MGQLLEPALKSPEAVMEVLEKMIYELRVAFFVAGIARVGTLTDQNS